MHKETQRPIAPGENRIEVFDWGLMAYKTALAGQQELVTKRMDGEIPDQLILMEHPPVITLGKRAEPGDILLSETFFSEQGVEICRVDRGGKATYHGPGQLVAYPIIELQDRDLPLYVHNLLTCAAGIIRAYGLEPVWKQGEPGLWINGRKVASIGVAVRRWVTYHGIALNVNTELTPFSWIVPCGKSSEVVTSMQKELGKPINFARVKEMFVEEFKTIMGYAA